LPKFTEKLRVCRELFHGFNYTTFLSEACNDRQRADLIAAGINHVLGLPEEQKQQYLKEALLLHQAMTLCQSLVKSDQRMEAAYFEAIRVALSRITGPRKISFREINRQINELLKQSIRSDGVINLFADKEESFSLFDPAFLEEIARMKGKNLAMELLRKLLSEQIELYKRTNLVQAEKFSERMARIMNAYRNGQISNAEVIDELRTMAEDIGDAHRSGDALGLSPEELAFYDAITKPEKVKDFYNNQQLCDMTRELTDALRKSRTIDWQKKDSARAAMRMMVKRLLKKYKYPPEGVEDAVKVVIAQCELWAEDVS